MNLSLRKLAIPQGYSHFFTTNIKRDCGTPHRAKFSKASKLDALCIMGPELVWVEANQVQLFYIHTIFPQIFWLRLINQVLNLLGGIDERGLDIWHIC